MRLHDTLRNAEAQPRSVTEFFRREEGLHDLVAHLFSYARPGVHHSERHVRFVFERDFDPYERLSIG